METDFLASAVHRWHAGSRRWLLRVGLGSGLATLLGITTGDAKKRKKRCKKKCPSCQTCKKGKCRIKPDGVSCQYGACQGGVCSCEVSTGCPPECGCVPPIGGGVPICASDISTPATSCDECPAGTVYCIAGPAPVECHPACST